jgi:hypothetical protein
MSLSSVGMFSMQFSFHIKVVHVPAVNKLDYFTDAIGNFSLISPDADTWLGPPAFWTYLKTK